MNLKLPGAILEVLSAKGGSRSCLTTSIQKDISWIARVSAITYKPVSIRGSVNVISNTAKCLKTNTVRGKTLNAACLHLNFTSIIVLSGGHVGIIIEPQLMNRLVWDDMCFTGHKVDTAKSTKYRAVGNTKSHHQLCCRRI